MINIIEEEHFWLTSFKISKNSTNRIQIQRAEIGMFYKA